MSDDRQNTREDEQRVPDAKDWRLFYPSKDTMKLDVDGTAYNQLPVVNIKSTNNNVIISLCKATGDILYCSSAGALGFRNARRKTNLAAQSVGAHIGEVRMERNINTYQLSNKRPVTEHIEILLKTEV